MKRQVTDWKAIFANYALNRGLLPKIYKEYLTVDNKKMKKQFKTMQKIRTDASPKKTYR